jgi:hypothetical protein
MLLAEASAEPLIEAVRESIHKVRNESDLIKRVDAVFMTLGPILLKHEAELRTLLKIALENSLEEVHRRHVPLLSARWVVAWDGILEPIRRRLSPKKYAVMVRALGTLLSIETLTVLRDACDFDDAATINALRSTARAMVRGFVFGLSALRDGIRRQNRARSCPPNAPACQRETRIRHTGGRSCRHDNVRSARDPRRGVRLLAGREDPSEICAVPHRYQQP